MSATTPREPGAMDVLLVEDEALVRTAVAECLGDAGLEVAEAGSTDAALAAVGLPPAAAPVPLPEPPPAVLVTDVDLGPASTMDGIALALALRRRWPGLGVVVVTGRAAHLARCAVLAPRERHFVKPFDPAELVWAVCGPAAPPPCASRR